MIHVVMGRFSEGDGRETTWPVRAHLSSDEASRHAERANARAAQLRDERAAMEEPADDDEEGWRRLLMWSKDHPNEEDLQAPHEQLIGRGAADDYFVMQVHTGGPSYPRKQVGNGIRVSDDGLEVRYLTDNRDADPADLRELVLLRGEDGDIYVSVVEPGHNTWHAVRICTSGGASLVAPDLVTGITMAFRALAGMAKKSSARLQTLSPREREVLDHIGHGLDNLQISVRMGIAERTVKAHVSKLYEKLLVENRAQLALIGGTNGEAS